MQALLLRWAVVALVVVAAAVAGYVHGVSYEQGRQAEDRVKEQAAWIENAHRNAERQRADEARVARALDEERAAHAKDNSDFQRKLKHAPRGTLVTKSCPPVAAENAAGSASPASPSATGSGADDDGGLSADGRELWNDALSAGATAAERAEWLASANAAPGPAGIRSALDNLRANAALLGECRAREALTQRWLCDKGFASCR